MSLYRSLFQSLFDNAQSQILNANLNVLNASNFEESVFQRSQISIPSLDTSGAKTQIEEIRLGPNNVPPGVTFTLGQTGYVAIFKIPIKGDLDTFKSIILANHSSRYPSPVEGQYYVIKRVSTHPIAGNDEVISRMKDEFKTEAATVDGKLSEFKAEVEAFHNNQLKPSISEFIRRERERRNALAKAEKDINPFS